MSGFILAAQIEGSKLPLLVSARWAESWNSLEVRTPGRKTVHGAGEVCRAQASRDVRKAKPEKTLKNHKITLALMGNVTTHTSLSSEANRPRCRRLLFVFVACHIPLVTLRLLVQVYPLAVCKNFNLRDGVDLPQRAAIPAQVVSMFRVEHKPTTDPHRSIRVFPGPQSRCRPLGMRLAHARRSLNHNGSFLAFSRVLG